MRNLSPTVCAMWKISSHETRTIRLGWFGKTSSMKLGATRRGRHDR